MNKPAVCNVARMEQLAAAVSRGNVKAIAKARRVLANLAETGSPETIALLLDSYAATTAGAWESREGVRQKVECLVDDVDDAADDCLKLTRWQRYRRGRPFVLAMINIWAAERQARHWLDHQKPVMSKYEIASLELVLAKAKSVAHWCRSWRGRRYEAQEA